MEEILLISLFFAHFLGDFTKLSTDNMLKSKQTGEPLGIAKHALTHALLTGLVVSMIKEPTFYLIGVAFTVQFVCHFVIDYLKYIFTDFSNNHPTQRAYWFLFGLDQFAHAVAIILIFSLVTK